MRYSELTNNDHRQELLTNEILGQQQNNKEAYFMVKLKNFFSFFQKTQKFSKNYLLKKNRP